MVEREWACWTSSSAVSAVFADTILDTLQVYIVFLTQSVFIEPFLSQAAQLEMYAYSFQNTRRDTPPWGT